MSTFVLWLYFWRDVAELPDLNIQSRVKCCIFRLPRLSKGKKKNRTVHIIFTEHSTVSVKGNVKCFQSLLFLGQNRRKDVILNVVKSLMTHISLSSMISFIVITVYYFSFLYKSIRKLFIASIMDIVRSLEESQKYFSAKSDLTLNVLRDHLCSTLLVFIHNWNRDRELIPKSKC